jgi:ring-1,2-phenylacetyl-CoA epoxidase subunit PaaE
MSTFYKLAIKHIHRETQDAVSISFHMPQEFEDFYRFKAGQYINLKLTLDGEEIRRAYSLSSTPHSHDWTITVKAVKNGYFSKFANEHLTAGKVLEVGTPEGRFTFEPDAGRQRNYAAFAAGSGITPVFSILKTVLEKEPNSTFVLVYGNKSPEQTIFYQALHDLQLQYPGRLTVHYVFSEAKTDDAQFGRIEKSTVNFVLKNKHKEKSFAKFYLCGPEEMIQTVSATLKENNIAENDIKFELFSSAESATSSASSADGHTQITVMVDDEETTFDMSQKQTLLEAALKQGLDAPYSCQGGICSSCIARIKKGSAEMKKNQILTDGEIAEGLILTCQAHPTSSEVYVDYDDI